MKIAVIGWYGTETIGDKAILAGIIDSIGKISSDFEILLGSLNPFFSERMFTEDADLYKKLTGKGVKTSIFNSKNNKELDAAIKACDLLLIGGGPLMHITPLFMLEYAFKKAKKLNKKTLVAGCGVGPFFKSFFKGALFNIFKNADAIVLRDSFSEKYWNNLVEKYNFNTKNIGEIKIGIDPAVDCLVEYRNKTPLVEKVEEEKPFIAINFRRFPDLYSQKDVYQSALNRIETTLQSICEQNEDKEILLVPMHYFHVGDDDRMYLNELAQKLKIKNLKVQNEVFTTEQTMQAFRTANFCVGMRFHSVVFQTILNGKNYVLDYTEPKIGKISGFLNDIDAWEKYQSQYICLQDQSIGNLTISNAPKQFDFNESLINEKRMVLQNTLKELLK